MIPLHDLRLLAPEQRPENRRRRDEPTHGPVWESVRSEAFFEDLDLLPLPSGTPGPALPLAA